MTSLVLNTGRLFGFGSQNKSYGVYKSKFWVIEPEWWGFNKNVVLMTRFQHELVICGLFREIDKDTVVEQCSVNEDVVQKQ